jgi:hypothetical protein
MKMRFANKSLVLTLVAIGVVGLVGLHQSGKLFANPNGAVASVSPVTPVLDNSCCYIFLTQEQKADLDGFRAQFEALRIAVTQQKKLLDEQINPALERLFGTHARPVPGTFEEHEVAHRASPVFLEVRQLQQELTEIELEVLSVARKVSAYERDLLVNHPGMQLDKSVNIAFNGLRQKATILLSLIADVYSDDPPCPACQP